MKFDLCITSIKVYGVNDLVYNRLFLLNTVCLFTL